MEREEAIKILKAITPDDLLDCWDYGEKEYNAIQTALKALENSIPKETIRDFIKNNAYVATYDFRTIEVSGLEELLEEKCIEK